VKKWIECEVIYVWKGSCKSDLKDKFECENWKSCLESEATNPSFKLELSLQAKSILCASPKHVNINCVIVHGLWFCYSDSQYLCQPNLGCRSIFVLLLLSIFLSIWVVRLIQLPRPKFGWRYCKGSKLGFVLSWSIGWYWENLIYPGVCRRDRTGERKEGYWICLSYFWCYNGFSFSTFCMSNEM